MRIGSDAEGRRTSRLKREKKYVYSIYIQATAGEEKRRERRQSNKGESKFGRQGKQRVGRKKEGQATGGGGGEKKWWKLLVLFRAEVTCNRGESCKHPLSLSRWTMD